MESGEIGIALAHNLIRNGHNSFNTSVLVRLLGLPFPKVNKEFSEKQRPSSRPRIEDHDDHINVQLNQRPIPPQNQIKSYKRVTFKEVLDVRIFEVDEQDQKERRRHYREIKNIVALKRNPKKTEKQDKRLRKIKKKRKHLDSIHTI